MSRYVLNILDLKYTYMHIKLYMHAICSLNLEHLGCVWFKSDESEVVPFQFFRTELLHSVFGR
jgi:hypothetical protein